MELDTETGRLTISIEGFEQLLSMCQGAPCDAAFDTQLRDAGVVIGQELHADVDAAVEQLMTSVCMLDIGIADPAQRLLHQLWLAPGRSSMLAQVDDGHYELATVDNEFLWVVVADLVGLGPHQLGNQREAAAQPRVWVADDVLADFGAAEARARAVAAHACGELLAPENAVSRALREGDWWAWWAECSWPHLDGTVRRSGIRVLDTPYGALQIGDELLRPVTSTQIWRSLLRLPPSDVEIAQLMTLQPQAGEAS